MGIDLSLTGGTLGLVLIVLVLFVLGIIFFLRSRYSGLSSESLKEKYANLTNQSPMKGRAKYPEADSFSLSRTFLLFGLAASILLVTLGFSWTSYEEEIYIPEGALELDEILEQEPPRTAEPPPPPPPPPPPVIEEVPEEEIIEEEEPVFEDMTVEEETVIEDAPVAEEEAPPPPPPPPPEEEEIFKVVEQMPRFPGCEEQGGSDKEKEECAKGKMLSYIYKNLKYPAIARENGVEGMAVIQFVVAKDGSVTDINLVRDPGAGTGGAAQKVVESMNSMGAKWIPGKQRGRPVKVLYTLPVKFKLEG